MQLSTASRQFFEQMKSMHLHSGLPTCLLDEMLHVVWHNDAAQRLCPTLSLPNAADALLQAYDVKEVQAEIAEKGSFSSPASEGNLFTGFPLVIYRSPEAYECFYILHLREWTDSGTGMRPQGLQQSISCFESNFRSPLTAITSALSLLKSQMQRDYLENSPANEYVRWIGERSVELMRSSQMFIDFTRLSNGLYYKKPSRIELFAYLESYFEEVALIMQEYSVDFSYKLPNECAFMAIATEPLHYILCQLISNACRFTRPNNAIHITASRDKSHVSIIVSDRGLGMPFSVAQHIFEPFFSYSPKGAPFAGNGLGLAMAQHCAAYLDGELTFTTSEGVGTSFRLTLPIKDDRSLATAAHTYTDDLELHASMRILLSDAIPCENF